MTGMTWPVDVSLSLSPPPRVCTVAHEADSHATWQRWSLCMGRSHRLPLSKAQLALARGFYLPAADTNSETPTRNYPLRGASSHSRGSELPWRGQGAILSKMDAYSRYEFSSPPSKASASTTVTTARQGSNGAHGIVLGV